MAGMRVHIFPKGISPKVKVIVQLELELAYYYFTARHVSHYTYRTLAFLLYFLYQDRRDWEVALGSVHYRFRSYRLIIIWEIVSIVFFSKLCFDCHTDLRLFTVPFVAKIVTHLIIERVDYRLTSMTLP